MSNEKSATFGLDAVVDLREQAIALIQRQIGACNNRLRVQIPTIILAGINRPVLPVEIRGFG